MSNNHKTENRGGDRYPQDKSNDAEWLSEKGGVRCTRIKGNGERCKRWASVGYEYCRFHGGAGSHKMSIYEFDCAETEKSFLRFRNMENYLSVQDELGIIRFCMEQLLKTFTAQAKKKNGGALSADALLVVAEMSKSVTQVAKDCNTIERGLSLHISIDTLEMWLSQICETFSACGASDEMVADFIEKVGKLQLPIGGRKSLRRQMEDADEHEAKMQLTDKELYDQDDDDEEENGNAVSRPTAAPGTKKKKKRKKKKDKARQDRDKPRNERDATREEKRKRRVKPRKQ